jgi:two-component system nitrogen regulation response regulator GlnG
MTLAKLPEESMKAVWIVDDDKSIRWVLEKTLSREKIPFRSFASATEALAKLDAGAKHHRCWFPTSACRVSPGSSCCNCSRSASRLPVIIMTAYSDLESAVSAFQGGAFEYLPKPFDVDQALELIRRAIGESMHQWCA